MLKDLVKVASRLDSVGLSAEADFIDSVIAKFAGESSEFIDPYEYSDQPGRKGGDFGPSKETEDAEEVERRHNKQYRRRDGGHRRGHREDFSDDANDARSHRRAKYPTYEYNEEGKILFPENTTDLSGEPVTHFRRKEPTVMGRRSTYIPDESTSSYTGDMPEYSGEDLEIERLAKRLASLGLTKEASILSSLVKSAGDGDDLDRELEEDEDPSDWTDAQWSEHESGIPRTSFYSDDTATIEKEYDTNKEAFKESLAKTVELYPVMVGPMRQLIQSLKHDFEQTNKPELSEKISELEKLQSSLEATYDSMYVVLNEMYDMDGDF